eukprot:PhM_4_TR6440/c0_g1_i1/m.595
MSSRTVRSGVMLVAVVVAVMVIQSQRTTTSISGTNSPSPVRISHTPISQATVNQATEKSQPAPSTKPTTTPRQPVMSYTVPHCGWGLLNRLGLKFRVDDATSAWLHSPVPGSKMNTIIVDVVFPSTEAVQSVDFNLRIAGDTTLRGGLTRRRSVTGATARYEIAVRAPSMPGKYTLDVIVTWVGDNFVGSRWKLPNRNDNPPFEEKKRKCLAAVYDDRDSCEIYGTPILTQNIIVEAAPPSPSKKVDSLCADDVSIGAQGAWERVVRGSVEDNRLLDDPVGLNRFDGTAWAWRPEGCRLEYFTPGTALSCLRRRKLLRVLLFGDSMLVEQFNMLRELFASTRARELSGKTRALRYMMFSTEEIQIKFVRAYTTSGGRSVLANAGTIARLMVDFQPDVAIGNFAVLHWQQNREPLRRWEAQLTSVCQALESYSQWKAEAYYLGPTQIQLGRTQGLQPSRTRSFARSAHRILSTCGFRYLDVHNMSVSRRESSFDGQHWACYHTYGGVSHMLLQLILNRICNR